MPDHYLTRMLLSQGVPPSDLGVPTRDGSPVETDGRVIWRRFAAHWHLFRGTPSRLWLEQTFRTVFGVHTPLGPATADTLYDEIAARLAEPDFRPRALFERFNIEVLATTESPLDDLGQHAKLAADGWGGPGGRVVTTFRPDDVVDMEFDGWSTNVERLGERAGEDTGTYAGYLAALRARRAAFIAAGATSSDHGHPTARTLDLTPAEAERLYDRGRRGEADAADAEAFRAHMLVEFARMSLDDGLVMQLHPGAVRNHNRWLHARHGRDVGGDIPQATEYVHALAPLLERYGNDPRLRVVLYTLDEDTFTRELAPLAGGYAALLLGAPWWFLDSPRCCAGSGRRSPKPRASTTPPGSSTTLGRSAPSRYATTSPVGSTPASWPGWSPSTGCRWTRPPRPSSTWRTGCPSGSSTSERPTSDGDHHLRRGARRAVPDRRPGRRLRRDQPG